MKQEKQNNKQLMYGNYDEGVDTEIEIKGKIVDVHKKSVRSEITTDVILAKWAEPKDKKFVLELAVIAGDSIHLVSKYYSDVERFYSESNIELPNNWETEKGLRIKRVSDIFMRRIDWLCNLNRNVENNHLIKSLLNSIEHDIQVQHEGGFSKDIKEIKKQFANQEHREERRD